MLEQVNNSYLILTVHLVCMLDLLNDVLFYDQGKHVMKSWNLYFSLNQFGGLH